MLYVFLKYNGHFKKKLNKKIRYLDVLPNHGKITIKIRLKLLLKSYVNL
jgi:hypothetical protein